MTVNHLSGVPQLTFAPLSGVQTFQGSKIPSRRLANVIRGSIIPNKMW
jgi:hypothetical protein